MLALRWAWALGEGLPAGWAVLSLRCTWALGKGLPAVARRARRISTDCRAAHQHRDALGDL